MLTDYNLFKHESVVHKTNNLGNADILSTSGLGIPAWSFGNFFGTHQCTTSKSKYFNFSILHLK